MGFLIEQGEGVSCEPRPPMASNNDEESQADKSRSRIDAFRASARQIAESASIACTD
jgi:hypothetical protein